MSREPLNLKTKQHKYTDLTVLNSIEILSCSWCVEMSEILRKVISSGIFPVCLSVTIAQEPKSLKVCSIAKIFVNSKRRLIRF